MNDAQKTEKMMQLVLWMEENLGFAMSEKDFTDLMQGILWTAFRQLQENFGTSKALYAMATVMQIAADESDDPSVRVHLVEIPQTGVKH